MKLNEGLKILKQKYPEYIIMVKNGIFYNATGNDAIILSKEFNLNRICFTNQTCKIGIAESKIQEFETELKKKDFKYIIYDYSKGEYKNVEEQFIERSRKDEGTYIIKEEKQNCESCNYHKRIENRNKITLASNNTIPIIEQINETNQEEYIRIIEKKLQLEKDIKYIEKILNQYLNNLIEKYIVGEKDE